MSGKQRLDGLLSALLNEDGSDLHLTAGTYPWMSIDGATQGMPSLRKVLSGDEVAYMLRDIVSTEQWDSFVRNKRLDFSYEIPESRFRGHYAISMGEPMAVFRAIPTRIPTFDDLGVPEIIRGFSDMEQGLVLFVGVTGSGKSTLQAAILRETATKYQKKIITVESPVEFKHSHSSSMIVQREIGRDVDTFPIGVQDAMREAPDVIQIGEMRDPDTMQAAISAATSGHLVFSTIHAESTADVPTRILDAMPDGRRNDVRSQLSRSLKAIVYQKLLPKKGGGRVAATEVLKMNSGIASLIRENKLENIQSQLTVKDSGCIPFERSLWELWNKGLVTESAARRAELIPDSFDRQKHSRS